MSMEYKENPEQRTAEITLDGKFTKEDLDSLEPKMQAFMDKHGQVKVLEIVKNFGGFDPSR